MGVKGVNATIDGVEALEVSRTIHTVAQWGVAPLRVRDARSNARAGIRAWDWSGECSRDWRRCGHTGQRGFWVNASTSSRRMADESSGEPIDGCNLGADSAGNGAARDGAMGNEASGEPIDGCNLGADSAGNGAARDGAMANESSGEPIDGCNLCTDSARNGAAREGTGTRGQGRRRLEVTQASLKVRKSRRSAGDGALGWEANRRYGEWLE